MTGSNPRKGTASPAACTHQSRPPSQPLMISRSLREVDLYQNFLCRQRQETSSRGEAMAQYVRDWDCNWNRNDSEHFPGSVTGPHNGQLSPSDVGPYNGGSSNSGAGSEDTNSWQVGSRLSSEGSLHVGGSQQTTSGASSKHSSRGESGYNGGTSSRIESNHGEASSYRGGSLEDDDRGDGRASSRRRKGKGENSERNARSLVTKSFFGVFLE